MVEFEGFYLVGLDLKIKIDRVGKNVVVNMVLVNVEADDWQLQCYFLHVTHDGHNISSVRLKDSRKLFCSIFQRDAFLVLESIGQLPQRLVWYQDYLYSDL